MKSKVVIRIILDLLIALSVLHGWWFVALPLGLIGTWVFPLYIELIIAGITYDALFGMNGQAGVWGYGGTIAGTIFFILISLFKKVGRR